MQLLAQLIFLAAFLAANFLMIKNILRIRKTILLGKDIDKRDRMSERIKMMVLVAFGQKKMFKKPLPAILHLFVYLGFLIVNLEMLEIFIDGLAGTHRVFLPFLGSLYAVFINVFEFFAVAVILGCAVFLIRRNVTKVARFNGEEMTRKPKLDANIILVTEIMLMIAFLSMNACDQLLQQMNSPHYAQTGLFFFSTPLMPVFAGLSESTLIFIERFAWWFHILGVLAFANYVFWDSKHLHIFLAFPNTFYSKLDPAGQLDNMSSVTHEVKLMLNLPVESTDTPPPGKFGASDVTDLTWKNIMEAFTCTECGRCTQQCPANITGKKLSPRKIMMDTRNRAEEVMAGREKSGAEFNDGKQLLSNDYISEEEILACTTCNACIEACPVNINPVDIIVQLRRFRIMEEGKAPAAWNMAFSNVDNNFAPWKFSPADRFNWASKLTEQK